MQFKNFSLSTIAGLTFGLLLVGYAAFAAWAPPTASPPGDNASAPVNTSATGQTKTGALTLEDDLVSKNKTLWGDDIKLGRNDSKGITQCGDMVFNDNSASPIQRIALHACEGLGNLIALFDNTGTQRIVLNPDNKTIAVDTVTVKGDGSISTNLNANKLEDLHAADLMAAGGGGGGGGAFTLWGNAVGSSVAPGTSVPSCPSGYSEALAGYGPYTYHSGTAEYTNLNLAICGTVRTLDISDNNGNNPGYTYSAFDRYNNNNYTNTCRVCAPTLSVSSPPVSAGSTVLYSTTSNWNGNLGGRAGADAKCSGELPAQLSGKVTNIHAFLSVADNDEIRDLHTNDSDGDGVIKGYYESQQPVYAYDRRWSEYTQAARKWSDLLDGAIMASMTKTDSLAPNFYYWTGSDSGGAAAPRCSGWASSTSSVYGIEGHSNWITSEWLRIDRDDDEDFRRTCGSSVRLICAAKVTGL